MKFFNKPEIQLRNAMNVFLLGIGLLVASSAFASDAASPDLLIDNANAAVFDFNLASNDLLPDGDGKSMHGDRMSVMRLPLLALDFTEQDIPVESNHANQTIVGNHVA